MIYIVIIIAYDIITVYINSTIKETMQALLEKVKTHLRIEIDDEDSVILGYILASIDLFKDYTDRQDLDFNKPSVEQALLLMVGYYYENREAGIDQVKMPSAVACLLQSSRCLGV